MELILSDLFSSDTATMTSIDIEVVTGSGHSEVKRSIERLANKGVIALPPTAIMLNKVNNRDYKTEIYVFSGDKAKRDSLIVVAQLSPEFTADIVDRWIYLEKENKSLTSQLEYWQTKDNDDFSVGSFHGKGLVERKKNKKVNNSMIQKIKNQMQLTLGFKYD